MKERMNERQAVISTGTQGSLAASSGAADVTTNPVSAPQTSTTVVVGGDQSATVHPQLTTLTAPRRMPTSSILQATLSAPPVNSSNSSNSTVSMKQQRPTHPVPPKAVIRQITAHNVQTGPPPGILQTQLTIQTNNISGNSNGPVQNQTTVMLPLTPHPNPHSASSSSLASPQQPLPTTPIDGQGSIAVPPSNILPSPISMPIDQPTGSTSISNNNNVNSVINNLNINSNNSYNTSSSNSNNSSNGSGSNSNANNSNDQIAISAIMESLMKDTAQFEAEKKQQQHLQSPQPPQSPLIANSSVVAINNKNLQQQAATQRGAQLIAGAQLPTCPVPQASLAEAGVVTSPAKQIGGAGGDY